VPNALAYYSKGKTIPRISFERFIVASQKEREKQSDQKIEKKIAQFMEIWPKL
jgi:hypothetical protein